MSCSVECKHCKVFPGSTCHLSPGAGMGRMVAVSVTPRGTCTAGLLLMNAVPLSASGAGASAKAGARAGAAAAPRPRSVGSLGRRWPSAPDTGGGAASGDSSGEGSGTMTVSGTFSST